MLRFLVLLSCSLWLKRFFIIHLFIALPKLVNSLANDSEIRAVCLTAQCSLQQQHLTLTPSQVFQELSRACQENSINDFDVYGDYNSGSNSFLKRFESDIARDFGKEDAVFMPSGVMAQSIALLIHGKERQRSDAPVKDRFACHSTSHLLLHEQDAYRELLGKDVVIINKEALNSRNISPAPMKFEDVERILDNDFAENGHFASTLIIELPHRELGGKLTPWEDIVKMSDYCNRNGVCFHCDGARIFEASAGYEKSLEELAQPFTSVYISFYKGLGGMSGAMLIGSTEFCEQARIWLRRMGGNLYTLMPYVVSGWRGYQRNWLLKDQPLSFHDKKKIMVEWIAALSETKSVSEIVSFEPAIPEVNMIHGYMLASPEAVREAVEKTEKEMGIRVLRRINPVRSDSRAYSLGYRSSFEWSVGEGNVHFSTETVTAGWKHLARYLRGVKP